MSFRPWTELAREAAKAMPPERVRRNGNQHFLFVYSLKVSHSLEALFLLLSTTEVVVRKGVIWYIVNSNCIVKVDKEWGR